MYISATKDMCSNWPQDEEQQQAFHDMLLRFTTLASKIARGEVEVVSNVGEYGQFLKLKKKLGIATPKTKKKKRVKKN